MVPLTTVKHLCRMIGMIRIRTFIVAIVAASKRCLGRGPTLRPKPFILTLNPKPQNPSSLKLPKP